MTNLHPASTLLLLKAVFFIGNSACYRLPKGKAVFAPRMFCRLPKTALCALSAVTVPACYRLPKKT